MGGTRNDRRPVRRRALSIAATLGLLVAMIALSAPNAAAVTNTCRARDLTQGTADSSDLQAVIAAAHKGDKIAVSGRCVGNFVVIKRLTIVGKATSSMPTAELNGNTIDRTLIVSAHVKLIDLIITGGRSRTEGAGILNDGTLTLQDTVVRGNASATVGGGIANETSGTLTLDGSSSVRGNRANYGGGIISSGSLTLNGSSSVSGNRSHSDGGGIYAWGTLTLNDSAVVTRNTADVENDGYGTGGGIFVSCGGVLAGGVDGGNVNDNFLGDGTENNIAFIEGC
jgi:predicted outer membrane repeat protein